ncbi:PEP-CTERM sorting domain-containing protein [Rubrivivax gelatinosus]|nr:PEP-CTERM sorting domain-containing protein [Rubrivivax gelatinosus]
MNLITRVAAGAILALSAAASQAAVVLSTPSLTGELSVSGFADGTPTTFSADLRDLSGALTLNRVPDGEYTVSVQGGAAFTGFPGGGIGASVSSPMPIFSGLLTASGLTLPSYSFNFSAGNAGVHDTALGTFGFSISYDGETSQDLMLLLASLFGLPFVDPQGAGTLDVSGTLFSDGAIVNFSESDLDWTGFGALLAAGDALYGGGNGVIDGGFELRDVTVSAVPEPATLALAGLALLGAGAARRRRLS